MGEIKKAIKESKYMLTILGEGAPKDIEWHKKRVSALEWVLEGEYRYTIKELELIAESERCYYCKDSNVLEFLKYIDTCERVKKIFKKGEK